MHSVVRGIDCQLNPLHLFMHYPTRMTEVCVLAYRTGFDILKESLLVKLLQRV